MTSLENNDRPDSFPAASSNAGKNVVLAMFLFAGVLVASMFVYWHFHTVKFRPLQEAIASEFPGSKPRVDGGKRKLHVESLPRVLRVVMKIDFNVEESPDKADRQLEQVRNLAEKYVEVDTYDELELHLYQAPPEREIKQWELTLPIRSPAGPTASADRPAADETPAPPVVRDDTAE
ncbi:MAG: hypothetical protein O2955_17570 [Planctomycetota bacterium]|nr:hypothetical protein [Planctomycetota bacterium]MDA1214321.1 hypothetical protein [Planctomycetota bacterium]